MGVLLLSLFTLIMMMMMMMMMIMRIIIIKRISRAPVYHTRWEHRALYKNTNNRHTHACTLARQLGDRHGCEKWFRKNY